ncbi:PEGA domain-containing protein [Salinivirga cyanobacteriivorans]|uniref:PEGA domain protein n=1 Tax=Salinivirga cyanobacteriivorans TaxID=1307839 RepID=A0A0S2I0V9_9BACT|nr:PEGA domain-containing protein [Salinivirga cyanobacteriivorans]ALO15879.1 PEGA domain protein [Salinivirga cyanobacteriivorans]
MKRITISLLVISISIILAGCATIVSGSKQSVKIYSTPSNAKVSINNVVVGNTPLTKQISRKEESVLIKIELDGYETYTTSLERKFNAWFIGNIVFGGLIGIIIDPITGAIYKFEPKEINAKLTEDEVEGIGYLDKNDIYIKLAKNSDCSDLEKIGELQPVE